MDAAKNRIARTTTPPAYPLCMHIAIIIIGMTLCACISVYQGKELSWDLANYHYYNPFAFLNARLEKDVWPASFVHVHFTPTLDFITYFLINHFSPFTAVFIMGAIHGINFWLLFCIATCMLSTLPEAKYTTCLALSFALLGLYGPTTLPGIGSFQQDNLASILVLGFIYLQLQFFLSINASTRTISLSYFKVWAGSVLLGIAAGGKLTAGLFVGGALLAVLILPFPLLSRIKLIILFLTGVLIGLLCASGYWMLALWERYQNPIFPLWNGIFHSHFFPFYNWRDNHFLPHNWHEFLLFPLYFSWDGRTGDKPFRDFRFAILYILFILCAVKIIWQYYIKGCHQQKTSVTTIWFTWFFLFSYLLWQYYFSIMRYIAVLEMLAPLMIYLILYQLIRDHFIRFTLITCLLVMITSTMVPSIVMRARWYQTDYFHVSLPAFVKQTPQANVLIAFPAYAFYTNPRPQTYLIPFFPPGWRFIGIPFLEKRYHLPDNTSDLINHSHIPIYMLASPDYMPLMYQIASHLHLSHRGPCAPITSDRQRVTNEKLWLCLVSNN